METPEEKIIREKHIEPIKKEINELKQEVRKLSDAQEDDRENIIKHILKRSPLYTRFKVYLQMQYLNLIIQPDRPATDQEYHDSYEWAHKTTMVLIEDILQWEKDGRPALYPEKVKKDLENTEE